MLDYETRKVLIALAKMALRNAEFQKCSDREPEFIFVEDIELSIEIDAMLSPLGILDCEWKPVRYTETHRVTSRELFYAHRVRLAQ